ncbi:SPOR domain-containing protein [Sagittula sp. SSi028]|uniref:SPOR domain-containing protein n=1 Tax=Sagittula sp. SSi028 TaxID=3400636 RepID=UPI003AF43013
MTIKNMALCATVLTYFTGFAQPVAAQSDLPVNFPPASFDGSQFVDNAGCVFVRAGFDGNVTWVPRVTRARTHVCGQSPTFGGVATASAPAAQPAPAPRAEPVQITLPAPVATAAAPAAAPKPAPVVRRTATTVATARSAPQVIKAPASKPVAAQPPRVVRAVPQVANPAPTAAINSNLQPVRIGSREACSAGKTYRVVNGKRLDVRCGPQTGPVVEVIRRGDAPTDGANVHYNRSSWQGSSLSPQTRIVPRAVFEDKGAQIAHVPQGYKPAWSDDRLNPYRGVQTVAGYRDTQAIWSNQVPRRLVSRANEGRSFPGNLWTRKYKHEVKDPTIAYDANVPYPPARVQAKYAHQAQYRTSVLSTKGSDAARSYVEIGVFSTAPKAQAAVQRLASAGLAVRAATVSHNGQSMQKLRVGPFASAASAQAALSAVHSVGYRQAYIR